MFCSFLRRASDWATRRLCPSMSTQSFTPGFQSLLYFRQTLSNHNFLDVCEFVFPSCCSLTARGWTAYEKWVFFIRPNFESEPSTSRVEINSPKRIQILTVFFSLPEGNLGKFCHLRISGICPKKLLQYVSIWIFRLVYRHIVIVSVHTLNLASNPSSREK